MFSIDFLTWFIVTLLIEQRVAGSIARYQWDEESQEALFIGKRIVGIEKET